MRGARVCGGAPGQELSFPRQREGETIVSNGHINPLAPSALASVAAVIVFIMVSSVVPSAGQARIDFIVSILGDNAREPAEAVVDGNSTLPANAPPAEQALLPRVEFINSVCILFDDNYDVIGPIAKDQDVSTLRDVALKYDKNALSQFVTSPPPSGMVPAPYLIRSSAYLEGICRFQTSDYALTCRANDG